MSDNNGWPGKPGVPLNPERDGWHWVKRIGQKQAHIERWIGSHWWLGPSFGGAKTNIEKYEYLVPALTPAEVDARVKEARRDALEKCISICNAVAHANRVEYPAKWKNRPEGIPLAWQQAWETCAETAEDIAAAIRALKGEGNE